MLLLVGDAHRRARKTLRGKKGRQIVHPFLNTSQQPPSWLELTLELCSTTSHLDRVAAAGGRGATGDHLTTMHHVTRSGRGGVGEAVIVVGVATGGGGR